MTQVQEILADLKRRKCSFDIDGERHWIVEGDLVLNEFRLQMYADEQARSTQDGLAGEKKRGLLAMVTPGADPRVIRWRPGKVLSYVVVKSAFRDEERYERATRDMRLASASWEAVCGVRFQHAAHLDGESDIDVAAAVFRVRQLDGAGSLIASAFFPDWLPDERWVNLYDGYFADNIGFDPIGVLRHELGHVLGFRHEHIRIDAPMDCPDEEMADTRALTEYDPESIMHYFCGGMGNRDLVITELDKEGAQAVYGPPLSLFEFVD